MKALWALFTALSLAAANAPQTGGELRFAVHADPRTLDPLAAADEVSDLLRYMTQGVLIRQDRVTMELRPELAESWDVDKTRREIRFRVRRGVRFSDGTPFTAEDVAFTISRLNEAGLRSPLADAFRSGGSAPRVVSEGSHSVRVIFPAPVARIEWLFDQLPVLSARSPLKHKATLGPFVLTEHKPGVQLLLAANPNYWKVDSRGTRLPYLRTLRMDILQNRERVAMLFERDELDLINRIEPDLFDRIAEVKPRAARDAGPGLEHELLWFNQNLRSPLPEHKKRWFRSQAFRRAVSEAINRADIVKVVYNGRAVPAAGPVSPANAFWYKQGLLPHRYSPEASLRRLAAEGFRLENGALKDREGVPVAFSLVTNSGNRSRERVAALIEQDLKAIGIRVQLATLDFPSLIERMTRTFDYDACLLGLVNGDPDPIAQVAIWVSSGANHQWNPGQKSPETTWEAEIDKLMGEVSTSVDPKERKKAFDRVQQIAWEQAPFLYLVYKNSLAVLSPGLANSKPAAFGPHLLWNLEELYWKEPRARP